MLFDKVGGNVFRWYNPKEYIIINQGCLTGAVFIDLRKTFGTVNREVL